MTANPCSFRSFEIKRAPKRGSFLDRGVEFECSIIDIFID